jgi:parallel beta-helix repeat protein
VRRSFFLVALLAATIAGAGTAARPPLTIGVTISQTGSAAGTAAYVLQGYQRWVGDANHHGGLLARPVRLKVYDDRSDPATAAALYRKLIAEDKVDLLAGPYASAVSQAVIPVVEEQHKVLIGQTAGTSLFTGEAGVQAVDSTGVLVTRSTLTGNPSTGVTFFLDAHDSRVENSTFTGNFAGVWSYGDGNEITGNQITGGAYGIILDDTATNNAVTGNASTANSTYDMFDDNGPTCGSNTWSGNTFDTRNQPCIN